MKKIVIVALALLALGVAARAQPRNNHSDVLWGRAFEESKRTTLADVIGHDESGIYTLSTSRAVLGTNTRFILEHFDRNMDRTQSVEIDLEQEGQDRTLEQMVHYNNRLFMFSSQTDARNKQRRLYVQPIHKASLQPQGEPRQIASIDYNSFSRMRDVSFGFSPSRDSTKFMVFYTLPYESEEKERFAFHVLDYEMNPVWERQIELPYQHDLFEVERYQVDNAGNIHLLGRIFNQKRKLRRRGEPNYKYQVLSYRKQGQELTEYPVEIAGRFLNDMQIAVLPNQDLVCAGFYSNDGTTSIRGSYFLSLDGKTRQIKHQSFKDFDADFLTENLTEAKAERTKAKIEKGKNVELYQFDLDNLILRKDGGAMLVGEQYYVRTVTYNTGRMMTTRTLYHYNNIIVVNITPSGEISWAHQIPKSQVTTDDGGFYSSYTMAVVKDKLYFVFNDNPKNLTTEKGKQYSMNTASKQALVVMVEMDGQGQQTKTPLFLAADAEVIIRPKVCEQIANNQLVVFGQRKRNHRFAKITFRPNDTSQEVLAR